MSQNFFNCEPVFGVLHQDLSQQITGFGTRIVELGKFKLSILNHVSVHTLYLLVPERMNAKKKYVDAYSEGPSVRFV